MSGCHVAMALALPALEIAWPIFVVLVLEWVVWPVAMQFLPNAPTHFLAFSPRSCRVIPQHCYTRTRPCKMRFT
jgi:hypothetical protein